MKNIFPILESDRFILRQIVATDICDIFKGLSDPDVIKYYGISYNSLVGAQEQMSWFTELEQTETGIWWAIVKPNSSTFYGAIGFNNLSKVHRKAELGFWLLPKFWGKGLMNAAIKLVCNYAFTGLNLHRIEAMVETENKNSKKILTKLGFNYEGTMKDCEVKNDKFISVEIYATYH
jgi:[ribosomal protein S5]-alanine N-acetyltransferase